MTRKGTKKINTDIPFDNTEIAHLINHTATDELINRAALFKMTQQYQDMVELSQARGKTKDPRYDQYIEWRTSWNYTKWEKLNVLHLQVKPTKAEEPSTKRKSREQEEAEDQHDQQIYQQIADLQSQLNNKGNKRRKHEPLPYYGIT